MHGENQILLGPEERGVVWIRLQQKTTENLRSNVIQQVIKFHHQSTF